MNVLFDQDIAALIERAIGKSASDLDATLIIMKWYTNDRDMQMWCCMVIYKYATEDSTYKQQLIDNDGHQSVLNALELHPEATEVIIGACKALGVIAMDNCTNRCILRCANAEPIIKAAMSRHQYNEDLSTSANVALLYISPHKLSNTTGNCEIPV
jgi:hypothetical protein